MKIGDVWGEIERYEEAVNGLLGAVFREPNTTLVDERTREVCGVHAYRAYQRLVSPVEARDFHSGVCASYEWFEKEENPTCPLSGSCGAYANAKRAAVASFVDAVTKACLLRPGRARPRGARGGSGD